MGAPISLLAAAGARNSATAASSGGLSPAGASALSTGGMILGIGGAIAGSIGAYYSVLAQRYQAESEASSLEFQGTLADLNARVAERDAAAILEAGKHEKGLSTLRFGQVKGASRARLAASGLQAGVGSAGEVQASIEAVKEIESLTIERNALRAAGAARMRAVNFRNQGALSRVSAANLRRFAGVLNPGFSAFTSLVGGAGEVSSTFLRQQAMFR